MVDLGVGCQNLLVYHLLFCHRPTDTLVLTGITTITKRICRIFVGRGEKDAITNARPYVLRTDDNNLLLFRPTRINVFFL